MDELDDLQFSLISFHTIPCTARYTSHNICDTAKTPTLYHPSSRHVPTLHRTFDLPRNSLRCNHYSVTFDLFPRSIIDSHHTQFLYL